MQEKNGGVRIMQDYACLCRIMQDYVGLCTKKKPRSMVGTGQRAYRRAYRTGALSALSFLEVFLYEVAEVVLHA